MNNNECCPFVYLQHNDLTWLQAQEEKRKNNNKKKLLITTKVGYPMGGGEQIFYEIMRWATELMNMNVVWLAFVNGRTFTQYTKFTTTYIANRGLLIYANSAPTEDNYEAYMRFLLPDVVMHQGHNYLESLRAAKKLSIPFIAGFNFWFSLVTLSNTTGNKDILSHVSDHKEAPEFDEIMKDSAVVYVASEFMQAVVKQVTSRDIQHVVYPLSSYADCCCCKVEESLHNNSNPERKYITLINIHKLKGGEILLQLMKSLTPFEEYYFLAVQTEQCSDELDKLIYEEMQKYPSNRIFLKRQEDVASIYSKTKILLVPSLVDETFGRVVVEAFMNGIPVLTSGQGHLSHFFHTNINNGSDKFSFILAPDNLNSWTHATTTLLHDDNFYAQASAYVRDLYTQKYNENIGQEQFRKVMELALQKSNRNNICFIAPFNRQGLTYQVMNYIEILRKHAPFVKCTVFAYKSYFVNPLIPNDRNQGEDRSEFAKYDDIVHYSPHIRESMQDEEILTHIKNHNIGTVIIPETCFKRVFEVCILLKKVNVACFCIPNAEIVRADEIYLHHNFCGILANNRLCEGIFASHGFTNVSYVGYSLQDDIEKYNEAKYNSLLMQQQQQQSHHNNSILKYLFLGGNNAFSRKQCLETLQAFSMTRKQQFGSNMILDMYIQKWTESEREQAEKYAKDDDRITLHFANLSHAQIDDLYKSHHVNIMVSSQEGLSIPLFEACFKGLPTITLKTLPHTEIIVDGENGYVVNCTFSEMVNNKQALFGQANVDVQDLSRTFLKINKERSALVHMCSQMSEYVRCNFNTSEFASRFLHSLNF